MYPPVSPHYTLSIPRISTKFTAWEQVPSIPKISAEDTTLTTTNQAGEKVVVPIPAGAGLNLHVMGMHYNRTSKSFLFACQQTH